MISLRKGTAVRRLFDRALEALPITQHEALWTLYIDWARQFNVPETAIRIYRRYLMFNPAYREDYVSYLVDLEEYQEAARQLVIILNDVNFASPSGKTRHELWMKLCDLCCQHPEEVGSTVNVDAVLRSGIASYSDEIARLWVSLADYYLRLGQFEKARDIYEEGLASVQTVRDFTVIFDTYVKVEESLLTAKMNLLQQGSGGDEDEEDGGLTEEEVAEEQMDVNLRLARLEYLLEERPFLLNAVRLRQNPHNVADWIKRIKLYQQRQQPTAGAAEGEEKAKKEQEEALARRIVFTFQEAVNTIHPRLATSGRLSTIYKLWAAFYEGRGEVDQARAIFEQGLYINYKSADELADLWCSYAEMEERLENYHDAWAVLQRAVEDPSVHTKKKVYPPALPTGNTGGSSEGHHVIDHLYKHTKVWSKYLELEEALGSLETVRAAYERCFDLKVITVSMVLHYAAYLEESHYFEEAFTVYERGCSIFHFPQVKAIYTIYLEHFLERYQGSKLERLRDLFESILAKAPVEEASIYYLAYAQAEERFGLVRRVMEIFHRAVQAVPDSQRLDLYLLYAKKMEEHGGLLRARAIYEEGLKNPRLPEEDASRLALEYAMLERKLNEIDRARAIYAYGGQLVDPRREEGKKYYEVWREFEEAHGNEETFREMLRVQRSVQVAFSQVNYLPTEMLRASSTNTSSAVVAGNGSTMDRMAQQAEEEAAAVASASGGKRKFVPAATNTAVRQEEDSDGEEKEPVVKMARNEEEIDI